jgi:hypothetical protein
MRERENIYKQKNAKKYWKRNCCMKIEN